MSELSGLLPVFKPRGMVSKDVSRWLERRLGKIKLGHVGTLDPEAEGVLPILLGRATRLQDYLLDLPKVYEAEAQLGSETDSLDVDGKVVRELPWDHVTEANLRGQVAKSVGRFLQTPPIYSAVKYKGTPLYNYAREGRIDEVPLESLGREVELFSNELIAFFGGRFRCVMQTSKGVYVRSVMSNIAIALNTCATVTELKRLESSGVKVDDTVSMETLEEDIEGVAKYVIPMEKIELGLDRLLLRQGADIQKLNYGQRIRLEKDAFWDLLETSNRELFREKQVLLAQENGLGFGIGVAKEIAENGIEISMKRGF